jgi:hypothetical protein
MLTILGKPARFCDGVSRRSFLKIGGLAGGALTFGGPTLADVLRADAAKPGVARKSIINIFLNGGPSHLDMFDLKPQAPTEIRGEFLPISTNVPGIEICSLMPNLAKLADKFAIIRSLTGFRDEHTSWQTETGWNESDLRNLGGHPSLGAVVAKLQGATNGSIPSFIDLNGHTQHGFLGPTYSAFRPDGPGRANLTLNGISLDRLNNRAGLLSELDRARRDMDNSRMMEAIDSFNQRAIGVITSSKLADALRTEKEDANVKERYGLDRNGGGENQRFLLSRRLIETGARAVSFSWGGWDTHGDNFNAMRRMLPKLDVGLSALILDLHERRLLESTAVVMWGEFGRTPRVNATAGRDHWSRASSAFIAGGGMKMGQVIGATNRYAEAPIERPVELHEVFATFYDLLGIDPKTTTLEDPNGRPQYLVKNPEPIAELVG